MPRIDGTHGARCDIRIRARRVVASRPIALTSASAATQRLTPRQPILEPTQAASGTPTSKVSDWPLMTQPSALALLSGGHAAGYLGEDDAAERAAAGAGERRPDRDAEEVVGHCDAGCGKRERKRSTDQERPAAPAVGAGAGDHRRDAPGDRGDGDQVGHQRYAGRTGRAPCRSGTGRAWCRSRPR